MTLSGVATAEDMDWANLVTMLEGVSAAQVVKVAQAAAKTAVLCGKRVVEENHLRDSITELKHPHDKTHRL